jgi:hypothetical protein
MIGGYVEEERRVASRDRGETRTRGVHAEDSLCFQLAVWSGRKPKGDSVGRAAVARARANPATGRDARQPRRASSAAGSVSATRARTADAPDSCAAHGVQR